VAGLCPDPLGELTAYRSPSWIKGWAPREGGDEGEEEEGWCRGGMERMVEEGEGWGGKGWRREKIEERKYVMYGEEKGCGGKGWERGRVEEGKVGGEEWGGEE